MPEPIKVTHIVLSLDCGGLERIVVDLVRQGRRLKQQVSIVCLERPGTMASQAEALGARIVCINKKSGLKLNTIGRMKATLRALRPTVVHTHQVGALFYTGPAAHALGVPLVVHTEHGNHIRKESPGYLRKYRMSWLWWLAARYTARFFCVSKDIVDELASRRLVPQRKLEVVANGIDTDLFERTNGREDVRRALGIAPDAPVLGTVGRLNEVKRQDLLIRSFAQVRKRIPDAHLVLVGDGPMRDSLQKLVKDLSLDASVHFASYQSQPERYLQAMDVFALTSHSEGMPLAILEAWAAGLPVVASAVGGVPDLVDHGRNGLLFFSGDESILADFVVELISDPQRAGRLGAAGRQEVASRYSLQRMAADYQRHYLQLLSARDRRGHLIPGTAKPCPSRAPNTYPA
jgi:sugar transferase (PEP-CTERM/EpsH1 system associated)